jgi:hypothetical protein
MLDTPGGRCQILILKRKASVSSGRKVLIGVAALRSYFTGVKYRSATFDAKA